MFLPTIQNMIATQGIILGYYLWSWRRKLSFNYSTLHRIPKSTSLAITIFLSSNLIFPAGHFQMDVSNSFCLKKSSSIPLQKLTSPSRPPIHPWYHHLLSTQFLDLESFLIVSSSCIFSQLPHSTNTAFANSSSLSLHNPFFSHSCGLLASPLGISNTFGTNSSPSFFCFQYIEYFS